MNFRETENRRKFMTFLLNKKCPKAEANLLYLKKNILFLQKFTLSLSITERLALFSILRSSSSVLNSVNSTWTKSNVFTGAFLNNCKILKLLEKETKFSQSTRFLSARIINTFCQKK